MHLPFRVVDERARPPKNAYGLDAGWDLVSIESKMVGPGHITDVRTGIAIDLPRGYYARIVHRSSTSRKKGIMVIEGTIDTGFQGELLIGCYEIPGTSDFDIRMVHAGDAIAQVIIQRVEPVQWELVDEFAPSLRGERGFGSSDEPAWPLRPEADL